MKTPHNIDVQKIHQTASDMEAFAFLLKQMEIDPNGTITLTANSLLNWSSLIVEALETEEHSS